MFYISLEKLPNVVECRLFQCGLSKKFGWTGILFNAYLMYLANAFQFHSNGFSNGIIRFSNGILKINRRVLLL
jgi:hypothetical protein